MAPARGQAYRLVTAVRRSLGITASSGHQAHTMIGPSLRRSLLLLVTVVGVALWLNSITSKSAITVGRPLGPVEAELGDGSLFKLSEHQGEVVVLSFWATWCVPCRKEAPLLSRLHATGVNVLGLSVDSLPLLSVSQKAREMGIAYPVAKATQSLTQRLGIHVVPTTCVVGRNGTVAMVQSGAVSYEDLREAVDKAGQR